MSAPTIQVLVGFQQTVGFGTPFQLDNATFGELDTGTLGGVQFVDVTDQAESISVTRGRNRESEQFNAGTASVRFNDPQRIFDPLNESSPYYPFVAPRNPIIISANGIPIFTGAISSWGLNYGFTTSANVTTAQAVDDFTVFANMAFNAFMPVAQQSGERVAAVLVRPEVEYQGGTAISTGASTLGAFAVPEGENVLKYLHSIAASEQGFMFMSAGGVFTFTSRYDALNPAPIINFRDDGTGIRYQSLTNAYDDVLIYNFIQTQSPAGAVQTASDPTSRSLFQVQTFTNTGLLESTVDEVKGLGEYLLGRYKDPKIRFTGVSTQLAAMTPAEQNECLSLDLTSIAAVTKSFDTGSPATVTQTLITSGVAHEIRPGSHLIRFTYESTDGNAYLTLDADPLGKLDTNLLAF